MLVEAWQYWAYYITYTHYYTTMLKCPYLLSLEYTKELNNSYKNILISWQFTKRPKLSENLISYYNGRYQMLYVIRLWQRLCVSTKYFVDISVDIRHCKHYINQYIGVIHRKYSTWDDIKYFMYVKRSHNVMIHKILLGSNKKMRICVKISCVIIKYMYILLWFL